MRGGDRAAHREDRAQARAGGVHPEGQLSLSAAPPGGVPARRLRRSLEVFAASSGDVYVLRGGCAAEWVIRGASAAERAVLLALQDGAHSPGSLAARVGCAEGEAAAALDQLDGLGLLEPERPPRRHDRQVIYLGEDGQERLRRSRVVVIGCGGLGCWALAALACAGIGTLVLVDDDVVALHNLNRQILYRFADLGRPKVLAARDALAAFDPDLELVVHRRRLASEPDVIDVIAGADVVVELADWPPHRLARWVDAACRRLAIPHVSAGQDPPALRIGPFFLADRPGCLSCLETAARREFPLYDELADARAARPATTATLGAASGVVGSLVAMEVIHHLTGVATPASANRAVLLDLATLTLTSEPVHPDPDCSCARWSDPDQTGPMDHSTTCTPVRTGTGTSSGAPAR
jgi:adenylyltransferase/sulfurtransferase